MYAVSPRGYHEHSIPAMSSEICVALKAGRRRADVSG